MVVTQMHRRGSLNQAPHVCFLIDRLARGGTEGQLLSLIRNLDRNRTRPHLCLLDGDDPVSRLLEPKDCPVLRLGIRSLHQPSVVQRAWRFAEFLRRARIDILHLYFPDSTYFGSLIGRIAGVRSIVNSKLNRACAGSAMDKCLQQICYRSADAIVTNCHAASQTAIKELRCNPRRMVLLRNAVELNFHACPPIDRLPRRRIALVANLRPVKAPDIFIRACRIVSDLYEDAHFFIAGDGELRSAVESLIDVLDLSRQVTVLGSVENVSDLLLDVDIGVNCSYSEGASNALLEYMAAGRAIVATAVGGNCELVEDRKHALLVPPGDPGRVAAAIIELLATPGLASTLSKQARQRALEDHDPRVRSRAHEDFYRGLMEDCNRPHRRFSGKEGNP